MEGPGAETGASILAASRLRLEEILAKLESERERIESLPSVAGDEQLIARVEQAAVPVQLMCTELSRGLGAQLLELQEELEQAGLDTFFSHPEVAGRLRPQLRAEREVLNSAVEEVLLPTVYGSLSRMMDLFLSTARDWAACQQAVMETMRGTARELHALSLKQLSGTKRTGSPSRQTSPTGQLSSSSGFNSQAAGAELRLATQQAHTHSQQLLLLNAELKVVTEERDLKEAQMGFVVLKEQASALEASDLKKQAAVQEAELVLLKTRLRENLSSSSTAVQRTEHVNTTTARDFEERMLRLEAAGREAVKQTERHMLAHLSELRGRMEAADARTAALQTQVEAERANTEAVRQGGAEHAAKQAVEMGKLADKLKAKDNTQGRGRDVVTDVGSRQLSDKMAKERVKLQSVLEAERVRADENDIKWQKAKVDIGELDARLKERAMAVLTLKGRVSDCEQEMAVSACEILEATIRVRTIHSGLEEAEEVAADDRAEIMFELKLTRFRLAEGTSGVRAEMALALKALHFENDAATEKLAMELQALKTSTSNTLTETVQRARAFEKVSVLELRRSRALADTNGRLATELTLLVERLSEPTGVFLAGIEGKTQGAASSSVDAQKVLKSSPGGLRESQGGTKPPFAPRQALESRRALMGGASESRGALSASSDKLSKRRSRSIELTAWLNSDQFLDSELSFDSELAMKSELAINSELSIYSELELPLNSEISATDAGAEQAASDESAALALTPDPVHDDLGIASFSFLFSSSQFALASPSAKLLRLRTERAVRKRHAPADVKRLVQLQAIVRAQGLKLVELNKALEAAIDSRVDAECHSSKAQLKLQAVAYHLHRFLGEAGSAANQDRLQQRAGTAPSGAGRAAPQPELIPELVPARNDSRVRPRKSLSPQRRQAPLLPIGISSSSAINRLSINHGGTGPSINSTSINSASMYSDGLSAAHVFNLRDEQVLHPILLNLLHDTSLIEGSRGISGPSPPTLSNAAPTASLPTGTETTVGGGGLGGEERAWQYGGQTLDRFLLQAKAPMRRTPPPGLAVRNSPVLSRTLSDSSRTLPKSSRTLPDSSQILPVAGTAIRDSPGLSRTLSGLSRVPRGSLPLGGIEAHSSVQEARPSSSPYTQRGVLLRGRPIVNIHIHNVSVNKPVSGWLSDRDPG